jgi:hypothetical protein
MGLNKAYCVLPWISVNVDTEGNFGLCCINPQNKLKDENGIPIKLVEFSGNIQDCKTLRDIREKMRNGEFPEECQRCYDLEKSSDSARSYRQISNEKFKDFIQVNETDLTIKHLDLRLGNACNLKCRMCSEHSSSKWAKEQSELSKKLSFISHKTYSNKWTNSEKVLEFVDANLSSLVDLRFAGGEPTFQTKPVEIMEHIVDLGYANKIDLKFNVNLTHIPQRITELWPHFKSTKITASLDGIGDLNTYIRYPSDWNDVKKNLKMLVEKHATGEISLNVLTTVQVYNIFSLDLIEQQMVEFSVINHDFTPVWTPRFLNVQCLPLAAKALLTEKYQTASSKVKKMIDFMNSEDLDCWEEFKQFTLEVDRNRNQSITEFVPELTRWM